MKTATGRVWFVCIACSFILLAVSVATSGFRVQGASGIGQKPQKNPKLSTPLVVLSKSVEQASVRPAVAGSVKPPTGFSTETLPKPLRDAIHVRQMRVTTNGEVQVYIEVSSASAQNLEELRSFGVTIQIVGRPEPDKSKNEVLTTTPTVQGLLPVTMITQVSALPFVRYIRLPDYGFTNTGSVVSQGDTILQAAQARSQFGVDGTGIRVGVISDGIGGIFDPTNCALSTAPNPIQTGDLPNATPTCANGVLTSVSGGITAQSFPLVTPNLAPPAGDTASDVAAEGTAMLEIVHDLAPGAQLYFANAADGTCMTFEQAVDFLALNTDVVVDDESCLTPPFDGTSDVSTNTANDLNTDANPIRGYFTAVGNYARSHYGGAYVDSGIGLANNGDLHLFQTSSLPNIAPSDANAIQLVQGGSASIFLTWNDPSGASANDYDLYLVDACTRAIVDSSTNPQTGTQDPAEQILGFRNTNTTNEGCAFNGALSNGKSYNVYEILIQNVNNAAAIRTFDMFIPNNGSLVPFASTQEDSLFNTISGSVPAESDAGGSPVSVVSVGATDAQTDASGNAPATIIEPYSSQGSTEATPNPQGAARTKPDVTATDGVSVTGAGGFGAGNDLNTARCMSGQTPCFFFGTSAAAPHAAAIAALVLQAMSTSTAGQSPATVRANLRNFLTSTAVPLPGVTQPVPNNIEGFGLLDALAAVKATGAPPVSPPPLLSTISPTSALVGSPAFMLSVSGSNFVSGSVINFNGAPQPTTFVSSTSLTAAISASSVAAAGSFSVTVTNPAPNGGTSAPSTFTVNNPLPVLNSISPTSVAVGSPTFTLSVSGSNFNASSVVNFNAKPVSTTFVSATALTASIPATDVATTATDSVTVSNPAPGGGTSTAATFSVSTSDFVLNVAGGGNATIAAGQTAIYKNAISLTDVNGFSFSVVLSCSTNAPMSTCSTVPSTLTQGANATIRVFTTQHGSVLPFANGWRALARMPAHAPVWLFLMLAVLFLMFGGQKRRRRFALSIPLALVLLSIIFESACASNPAGGTSAGSYTVSVTGVSGTIAHTITLGLTVK